MDMTSTIRDSSGIRAQELMFSSRDGLYECVMPEDRIVSQERHYVSEPYMMVRRIPYYLSLFSILKISHILRASVPIGMFFFLARPPIRIISCYVSITKYQLVLFNRAHIL